MKQFGILLLSALTAFSNLSPAEAFPTVDIPHWGSSELVEKVQWDSDRRWRPHGQWWRGNFRHRHYDHRYHDRRAWRHHHRRDDRSKAAAVIGGLAAGATIGGAIARSQQPRYTTPRSYVGGDSHVKWCFNRYRSYSAYDNTFQPYDGPRQQCYSPY